MIFESDFNAILNEFPSYVFSTELKLCSLNYSQPIITYHFFFLKSLTCAIANNLRVSKLVNYNVYYNNMRSQVFLFSVQMSISVRVKSSKYW
jgi:hypothetical protein